MESIIFISVVIIALTQMVKMALPERVHGFITILIALVVGVVVSMLAEPLGLATVSIAEGIVGALGAIGITTATSKAGGGTVGDE